MTNDNQPAITVPDHFLLPGGVDPRVNAAVAEAIGAVGGAPKGWTSALQRVREAEFTWLKATSLSLVERAAKIEQDLAIWRGRREGARGAAALDLDETIRQGEINLTHAREIAALVPEEAARLQQRRGRAERQREYQRLFDAFHNREARHEPTTPEQAQVLVDLDARVRTDAAAEEAEQQQGHGLFAAVEKDRTSARQLLRGALQREMFESACVLKAVVGAKAATYSAFPKLAPEEIGRCYLRARYLAGLSARLHGPVVDVDARFAETIGADDWTMVCSVIRHQTGILPRSWHALAGSRSRASGE